MARVSRYLTASLLVSLFAALIPISANATVITVNFMATVTSVQNNQPAETWGGRILPIGTVISGSYDYEPFPSTSNPFQIINGHFSFSGGALASSASFLNIAIDYLGEPNYSGGDRYRPNASNDLGVICGSTNCGAATEAFWIDLDTMAHVLPPDPITTLPNFTLFDTHIFHYQISTNFGRLEIDADLTSLAFATPAAAAIAEPASIPVFVFGLGLLIITVAERATSRSEA